MQTYTEAEALAVWARLGQAGCTVSICCGPSGIDPTFRWSVSVMSRQLESFDRPFAADSFTHAVAIAEHEIVRRGWSEDVP